MKQKQNTTGALGPFYLLWSTQSLSALGSAMTGYALVIWSYQQTGSALSTALLSICSYAPYVLMSVFAGALSDRWNKKRVMLVCDFFAAMTTLAVLWLYKAGLLVLRHLYVLNALNGLMNTFQQPASGVAVSLLTPRGHYQRVGGLQSLSNALTTVLTPALASAMLAFGGLTTVIWFDLLTCAVALAALSGFIRLPSAPAGETEREPLLAAARSGLRYLRRNRGILDLILFLATINLTASVYNAALPAMLLSRPNGGDAVLGLVNSFAGLAMLAGGVLASLRPAPKSRVRTIQNALLFSMSTENLLLALGRSAPVWCLGAVLGWLSIPVMNANMDALFRSYIPLEMQGRVYSARNTLQFFTIPLGNLLGGAMIDRVLEPLMASMPETALFARLLGTQKGAGAALMFLFAAAAGVLTCLVFRRDRHIRSLEAAQTK